MHAIVVLYARRWDIEMALQRSQQLWATLVIARVLLALRMEIALKARVDVFDVTLPLVARYAPRYAARGEAPLAAIVRDGRLAGFIRPSRRIVIENPAIDPAKSVPLPPGTQVSQTPRYAHRRCQSAAQVI
jgi:hypothetical protein